MFFNGPHAPRPRLRSTDHGDLVVPRANTDRFGRRGFSVSGPNRWNKLPPDKPEQFARALKTFLSHGLTLATVLISMIFAVMNYRKTPQNTEQTCVQYT